MRFSKSFDDDHQSRVVANSLAVREAVKKLALSPKETVKYLNGDCCIWSNSEDKTVLVALKVLKKFYRQLQRDVDEQKNVEGPIASESLLRFLVRNNDETTTELISRRRQEDDRRANWRHLKIADKDMPDDVVPVPVVVPRLDEDEFRDAGWSEDSEVYDKVEYKADDRYSESSSTTSGTPVGGTEEERLLWKTERARKNVMKIVKKVDKAISPRTPDVASAREKVETPKSDGKRDEAVEIERVLTSRMSKGIQTDFEVVRPKTADASVSAHFTEAVIEESTKSSVTTTSLHRFIGKTSDDTTPTSSSIFSSNLSAGEVPSTAAATLTSKKKYTILTVEPDGSIKSFASNYQAYRQTHGHQYYSSPSLMESRDEVVFNSPFFTSTPVQKTTFSTNRVPRFRQSTMFDSRVASTPPRIIPLAGSGSSDSDAILENTPVGVGRDENARSGHTIVLTPASADRSRSSGQNVVNKSQGSAHRKRFEPLLDENEGHDDESTLNQVSPLPSRD